MYERSVSAPVPSSFGVAWMRDLRLSPAMWKQEVPMTKVSALRPYEHLYPRYGLLGTDSMALAKPFIRQIGATTGARRTFCAHCFPLLRTRTLRSGNRGIPGSFLSSEI